MTSNNAQDVEIALLKQKVTALETGMGERIKSLEADRASALKWGILTLGSTVIGLAGLIASWVAERLK